MEKKLIIRVAHNGNVVMLQRNKDGHLVLNGQANVRNIHPDVMKGVLGDVEIWLYLRDELDDPVLMVRPTNCIDQRRNAVRVNGCPHGIAFELCGPSPAEHHIKITGLNGQELEFSLLFNWGYPIGSTVPVDAP